MTERSTAPQSAGERLKAYKIFIYFNLHAPVDSKGQEIHNGRSATANAAGGMWSNLEHICKWIIMQMNNGRYGEGLTTQLFIPELKQGIIVLTNQQSVAAFNAATATIKDSYPGVKGIDRIKEQKDHLDKAVAEAKKITDVVL